MIINQSFHNTDHPDIVELLKNSVPVPDERTYCTVLHDAVSAGKNFRTLIVFFFAFFLSRILIKN